MRPETSEKKEFAVSAEQTLQTAGGGGNILFESGGEFVLPDYLPKVQKVLRLEANALPPTKYMSGGEAQMRGSVLHTLIYVIVMVLLYIIGYMIQQRWVFAPQKQNEPEVEKK